MGEDTNAGLFIVMNVVLLISFIGLTISIFNLGGLFFVTELILLIAIIAIAFFAMVVAYLDVRFGWLLLAIVFAVTLIDVTFLYFAAPLNTMTFFLMIVVATIGFIISVVSVGKEEGPLEPVEPEVERDFEPGKYVGSSTGRSYHAPKCDWAKKIKQENMVWFDSKEQAKKKGYKAHSCIN